MMRNRGLRTDFNNLRGMAEPELNEVLEEAENYITFLEGKEDRLTKMEDVLGEIDKSNLAGKEVFLDKFKEFKNA